MSLPVKSPLPNHVALIMDGNGRWARKRGLPRLEGHRQGSAATEEIITCARETGISCLTLYAFSTENWSRPQEEIAGLMTLLGDFLNAKRQKMIDNGIRLNVIGDVSLLPKELQDLLTRVSDDTRPGKEMVLTLALSYSSRDEIVRAIRKIIARGPGKTQLDEGSFAGCLDTADLPPVDLMIRTGGEMRISNFLLWQAAYAELVFEKCLWPDFTRDHFLKALAEYGKRERRFGGL